MDIGFTRPMGRSISQSTNATNEKPKIVVPGPQATHAERQNFVNDMLKPGRQRFELSALSEKQLARFVAYFRIKSVDPNDANEVARFIQGYEQYCGNEQRLDRDGAIASLREHIAKEPNASELEAILNEHTEVLGDLLAGRPAWEFFNLPNRDGHTPLMRAVRENDEELVRDLLLHGAEADVDAMVVAVHHNMPFSLKKCLILASEVEHLLLPSKDGTSLLRLIAGRGDYQSLDTFLNLCLGLERPVDLRDALESAADRGDWRMLGRMLLYLREVHKEAPIPIPIPALAAAVERFQPGVERERRIILGNMFVEALLGKDLEFNERREIFQLLVDLAQKDRKLAVEILQPVTRSGVTISELIGHDVPGLVGLLVGAGANIREVNNNGDLLETAIGGDLSLATIEEVLMGFAAAGVAWNHNVCLQLAMDLHSQSLGLLLVKYGAVVPDRQVYEFLYSPPHLS
jgi:Ankyrin repeat